MRTRFFVQIAIALAVGALPLQNAVAQGDIQSGFNQLHQNWGTTCQQSGGYAPGCGSVPAAAPASPAAPTSLSEALTPAVQSLGNAIGQQIGQQIGKAIFGDPAAAAAAQQRNLAAQQSALAAQQSALAAQQLNKSGIYLLKQRNYTGAINEFQQALAIAPNDANILHNLASAKQQLKDVAVAARTSGALGQFLGDAPPVTTGMFGDQLTQSSVANPNASALSLVNLDSNVVDFRGVGRQTEASGTVVGSDPNVVDLRGTTSESPSSLKTQLDGVFANTAPVSAPPATLVNPIDREQQTRAQVDAIFEKPVPDPNATMKAIFDLNYKSK